MKIFSPRTHPPTDAEILSFWQMMFAPDQTQWDYEDNAHLAHKPDAEVIHFIRNTVLIRETNHGFWAREDGHIVGMAGLNLFTDPSKVHCAELGFSVRRAYQRRGIGYQLVTAAIGKAYELGLQRIECSCFANNVPSIALLKKAGFREEGLRTGAILKNNQLRDIREFGLLQPAPIPSPKSPRRTMKIVLIGAGSFVFGPTVLLDALVKHKITGELALVDLNRDAAEAMAGVGNRIARDLGIDCAVIATANRREALPGADVVILSAAPQGRRRWLMDYDILIRADMPDQARECAGLGGLSYALRTISMALDICEDMAALCPSATLLDVTNPMPRVVSAINRFTDTRAYGFCNVAQGGANGYAWIASLVKRTPAQIDVITAGLNHFAWVLSVRDKVTGDDLLPVVETTVREGGAVHPSAHILLNRWLDTYGAVVASGTSHAAEFLPFDPDARYATSPPYHGDAGEREARMRMLHDIGAGTAEWRGAFTHGSWEHPIDVAVALDAGATLRVPMLNLPNRGYLPDLPDGVIVEVPAIIENGTVRGVEVGPLPERVAGICRPISAAHKLAAEGAATGDRRVLEHAIVTDPAITDKAAARRVLDEMIDAHRDLLPRIA